MDAGFALTLAGGPEAKIHAVPPEGYVGETGACLCSICVGCLHVVDRALHIRRERIQSLGQGMDGIRARAKAGVFVALERVHERTRTLGQSTRGLLRCDGKSKTRDEPRCVESSRADPRGG